MARRFSSGSTVTRRGILRSIWGGFRRWQVKYHKELELPMSFNWYARKVRNPEVPLSHRRTSLHTCIGQLTWLTRERYTHALARFNARFGFDSSDINEKQLLQAL